MSLARKVAHNTVIQGAGKVLSTLIGISAIVFLTRYLGDYQYGQYTTIMVYLQIFGILMDLGLFIILIKKLSAAHNTEQENVYVNNTFTCRLITGASLLLLAIIIAWFIPSYDIVLKWGIMITSVNILFVSLNQLITAIYQRHLAMGKVALAEITGKIFFFISTVSIIFVFKTGLLTVMLAVVIGGLVNFLILFIGTFKYYKIKFAFNFKIWKELFIESWPIAISISLTMLYFKTDTLFLGWIKTQKEVGIYGAPYKILEVIITLPAMFVGLVMPVLSKTFHANDMAKFKNIFQKSFDTLSMAALPLIAGALVVAQPLMILVAGDDFTTNMQDLGINLQILIFAVGFIFIGTLTGYLIVIIDQQKNAIKAYAFVALTAVAGYLIFIPKYSYFGAAAVTVYSEAAMMLFGFYFIYKVTKVVPSLKTFFKAVLASITMMLSLYLLPEWHVLILIPIGGVVYIVALYLLKAVSKQDMDEILNLKSS